MKLAKLHEILFVLSFVSIQIFVKPVQSNLSYENKNVIKIKQDPTRYQAAAAYRNKKNAFVTRYSNMTTLRTNKNVKAFITSRLTSMGAGKNNSKVINKIGINNDKKIPQANQLKKWQVGRVSRKQYEIINMLWRKTKIFVDMEHTTPNDHFRKSNETERIIDKISGFRRPFDRLPSRPSLPSTTPSYIEFYYLDETDERKEFTVRNNKQVSKQKGDRQLRNLGNRKFVLSDSPMFSFRIDNTNLKRSPIPTRFMQPTNRGMKRRKTRTHDSSLTMFNSLNSLTPSYKYPRQPAQQKKIMSATRTSRNTWLTLNITLNVTTQSSIIFDNQTCPDTTKTFNILSNRTNSVNVTTDSTNDTVSESTTAYDKIKFFEMYDKHTPIPYYDENGRLIDSDNVDILIKGNELQNSEDKVLLEHVDQAIGNEHSNHKAKHSKKHIIDTYKKGPIDRSNDNSIIVSLKPALLNFSKIIFNVTKEPTKELLQSDSKAPNFLEYKKSKEVPWSQYPFAAAYVYEPSQVHCDAAGISPHWLVTSGSCLSRHHKNPGGEGRSAFVTYCGDSWWNPERVAYVKYSLVHPRYHPRDKTRRHLYNIGLIQVVTSMASACNSWSSISLMSHQFVADGQGAVANAIGWGLDRFDTKYSSNDLPKSLLMSYENQVFSDSCPGNIGYSKAKRLDEEGGIKNVYCLALPPYSGEETDPVHGGLMLVGGKLVALYLQEERRPWGDQCAQYTGTWRLVPWVLDVARENDETDAFTLEI
nr:uncharacterized protein LOC110384122 [Helicoverpa armigera]